jgi:hypothetical protein
LKGGRRAALRADLAHLRALMADIEAEVLC